MTVKKFLELTTCVLQYTPTYKLNTIRPRVLCKDGFSVSIQANHNAYCTPEADLEDSNYTEVELGYPNQEDELLLDYAEDVDCLTDTVYPYVPIEIIEKVCENHGGIIAPDMTNMRFANKTKKELEMLDRLIDGFRKNCNAYNDGMTDNKKEECEC